MMPGVIEFVGLVSGLNSPATGEVEPFATYGSYGLVAHRATPYKVETVSFANPVAPSVNSSRTDLTGWPRKALTDTNRNRIYVMGAVGQGGVGGQRVRVFSGDLSAGSVLLGTGDRTIGDEYLGSAALCNNGMTLVASAERSSSTDDFYVVWDVSPDTPIAKYASPQNGTYGQFSGISYPMSGIYNEKYAYYCAYAFGGSPLIPLDLSNPSAPVQGTRVLVQHIGGPGSSGVRGVIVNKMNPNYLYASYEDGTLKVFDISNRMNPVFLRAIARADGTPWSTGVPQEWPTSEQYQQDGNFIVGGAGGGVHVIDVNDPGYPKLYASLGTQAFDFQGGGGGLAQVALLPNNHFAMSGKNISANTPAVAVFKHDFMNLTSWAVGCA